jgi:hypothetical protein
MEFLAFSHCQACLSNDDLHSDGSHYIAGVTLPFHSSRKDCLLSESVGRSFEITSFLSFYIVCYSKVISLWSSDLIKYAYTH